MSTPGPWETLTGDYLNRGGLVGYVSMRLDGLVKGGQVRPAGHPTFSGGQYEVLGLVVQGDVDGANGSYGVGLAEVPEMPMYARRPQDFGAVQPATAIGYEWETPDSLATPGTTTIPTVDADQPMLVQGSISRLGEQAHPSESFNVRRGFIGTAGVTLGAPSGVVRQVTAAPGITGPTQFPAFETYVIPAAGPGTGATVVQFDADYGITLPGSGSAGWAVFVMFLPALLDGQPTEYAAAQGSVTAFKTAGTPYSPTSRYRWLYEDTPTLRYGWGAISA